MKIIESEEINTQIFEENAKFGQNIVPQVVTQRQYLKFYVKNKKNKSLVEPIKVGEIKVYALKVWLGLLCHL